MLPVHMASHYPKLQELLFHQHASQANQQNATKYDIFPGEMYEGINFSDTDNTTWLHITYDMK